MRTIILILCIFFSTRVVAKSSCEIRFRELYDSIKAGILNDEERSLIAYAYQNKSEKEANKAAFDIYINARLSLLPEKNTQELRKILEERVYVESSKRGTHFDYKTKKITLLLPNKYKDSIIDHMFVVHELEHAIQNQLEINKEEGNYIKNFFYEELGAMAAEYEFLSNIPQKNREDLISKMQQDDKEIPYRQDIIRWLKNSSLSRPAYILNEWKHNRYSKKFMIAKNINLKKKTLAIELGIRTAFFGTLGLATKIISEIGLYSRCTEAIKNRSLKAGDSFFKKCSEVLPKNVIDDYLESLKH